MIARKLKKLRKPEYGTRVPSVSTRRSTTLKIRIAIATRSIGEVLRNHTKKRREEIGAKFRVPAGQYIVASAKMRPQEKICFTRQSAGCIRRGIRAAKMEIPGD